VVIVGSGGGRPSTGDTEPERGDPGLRKWEVWNRNELRERAFVNGEETGWWPIPSGMIARTGAVVQ